MAFNINEFINATKDGLARESQFEMLITLPRTVKGDARQLSILCHTATLPNRGVEISTVRRGGQGLLTPIASGLTYQPLNVTFYCDAKGNTIKTLQNWMDSIMDLRNSGNLYMMQYRENYGSTIILNQYAADGTGIATYKFDYAFISSLGPINFSWASRNNLIMMPATFSYTLYTMGDAPQKIVPNLSTGIQPAQTTRLPVTGNTPTGDEGDI
jgi:hypothetical protein